MWFNDTFNYPFVYKVLVFSRIMGLFKLLRREFKPYAGMRTTGGLNLALTPSINSKPEIKFAVFSDARFYDAEHYFKFAPFLPLEIRIIGPPADQNCFGFCMNVSGFPSRQEFSKWFENQGYLQHFEKPATEDIVLYHHIDPEFGVKHSAVYSKDGRVQSRWGMKSPLIEHPVEQVPPDYMHTQFGFFAYFRKKQKN